MAALWYIWDVATIDISRCRRRWAYLNRERKQRGMIRVFTKDTLLLDSQIVAGLPVARAELRWWGYQSILKRIT